MLDPGELTSPELGLEVLDLVVMNVVLLGAVRLGTVIKLAVDPLALDPVVLDALRQELAAPNSFWPSTIIALPFSPTDLLLNPVVGLS